MSPGMEKPKLLAVGDEFPEFELPDENGEVVTKADLLGSKAVIFIYPKDNTAGCTREVREFTEALPRFEAKGVKVFGLSKDSMRTHRNFIQRHGLGVRLLSDVDHILMEAVGAWAPKISYGRLSVGAIRSTFILDEDGRVEAFWRNVRVPGHVDEVLSKLDV